MTPQEIEYWNKNTNEQAALAYAVENGAAMADEVGLSESEPSEMVSINSKGTEKMQIPAFAGRAFDGDAMLGLPETETTETKATKKKSS